MVTGGHGTLTWEEAAECFSAAVAPCISQAKNNGIALRVVPAPPVYAHSHIAHNLRDTITLAEMAGIGICIDILARWIKAGLTETIEQTMAVSSLTCEKTVSSAQ